MGFFIVSGSFLAHDIVSPSGKPGPVSDLELSKQQDWEVKLTWTPADDHNSPIESKK